MTAAGWAVANPGEEGGGGGRDEGWKDQHSEWCLLDVMLLGYGVIGALLLTERAGDAGDGDGGGGGGGCDAGVVWTMLGIPRPLPVLGRPQRPRSPVSPDLPLLLVTGGDP